MRQLMVVVVGVMLGLAQPQAQQVKPQGPEGSQLGFYLGKWTEEGQSRQTPSAAFGKLTGEETWAWFSGGSSVVCRETTQDKAGETDSIYILSYDAGKKVYTMYGTDNYGVIYALTGTYEKDVWRWTGDTRKDGVSTPTRYTFRAAGSGSHTMDVETSTRGAWSRSTSLTYKRASR